MTAKVISTGQIINVKPVGDSIHEVPEFIQVSDDGFELKKFNLSELEIL